MRIDTNQDELTSVIVTARVKKKVGHRCPPSVAGSAPDMTREAEKVRQQRALDMCGFLLFIEIK